MENNGSQEENGNTLGKEPFLRVKEEVRQSWRSLGMLHLRMQNALDADGGKSLAARDVRAKLETVIQKLERALAECGMQDGEGG